MFSFKLISLLALAGLASCAPVEERDLEGRVLPSGHPVINNEFLSEYGLFTEGYVVETAIYPSGFVIPTQTITALPSGYSVAWNAVYNPEGEVVTAFPEEALAAVLLEVSSTSAPGAPSQAASSSSSAPPAASSTASADSSTADSDAAGIVKPSAALALLAVGMCMFM